MGRLLCTDRLLSDFSDPLGVELSKQQRESRQWSEIKDCIMNTQDNELVARHVNSKPAIYIACLFFEAVHHHFLIGRRPFSTLSAPGTGLHYVPCGCPVITLTMARSHRWNPSANQLLCIQFISCRRAATGNTLFVLMYLQ